MHVINHNWSATKQHLHPQSVAEISRHSVLSGDRIRQCGTSSGSRHKARSVSVSRHFLLQAPQCPCSVQKRFTRHHCCQGRSKPGCRIVGSHTRWSLLRVFGNVLYNLQLLVAFNCYSSVCCPFCKNDYHCMCHWCCWDCRGLCYSLGLKASPGLVWWRLHLMMLAEKAFFIVYMYCIRLFRFYTTYTCHAKHMML